MHNAPCIVTGTVSHKRSPRAGAHRNASTTHNSTRHNLCQTQLTTHKIEESRIQNVMSTRTTVCALGGCVGMIGPGTTRLVVAMQKLAHAQALQSCCYLPGRATKPCTWAESPDSGTDGAMHSAHSMTSCWWRALSTPPDACRGHAAAPFRR